MRKLVVGLYAGVSQLARESGSYPECHWFESDRRYQRAPSLRDGALSYVFYRSSRYRRIAAAQSRMPSVAPGRLSEQAAAAVPSSMASRRGQPFQAA